jgi:orotate phosphoribosyltransferase
MNNTQRQQLQSDLQQCQTVGQMLLLIINKFNLDVVPGAATKAIFISALLQAVQMLKLDSK